MFANMRGTGANNLLQHNLAQSKQFTCTYICILVLGKLPLCIQGYWKRKFRIVGDFMPDTVKEKVGQAEEDLKEEMITEVRF